MTHSSWCVLGFHNSLSLITCYLSSMHPATLRAMTVLLHLSLSAAVAHTSSHDFHASPSLSFSTVLLHVVFALFLFPSFSLVPMSWQHYSRWLCPGYMQKYFTLTEFSCSIAVVIHCWKHRLFHCPSYSSSLFHICTARLEELVIHPKFHSYERTASFFFFIWKMKDELMWSFSSLKSQITLRVIHGWDPQEVPLWSECRNTSCVLCCQIWRVQLAWAKMAVIRWSMNKYSIRHMNKWINLTVLSSFYWIRISM